MINLFQITPNDGSMLFLSAIFGNVNGVISLGGQPVGESITLLGTMFKTFNSIVLVVAILVLVYVTVVGVIATAYEGEFLGKKWNNIWVPLRLVIGFALLVPTGSGYCGIQILIMWVIVQGIGAADTIWNTALSYASLMGSPYAKSSIPNVDATQKISLLFQGLVCDASSRQSYENPIDKNSTAGGYYCYWNKANGGFCGEQPVIDGNSKVLGLGPSDRCGKLTYCDQSAQGDCKEPNSLACLSCQAQVKALTQIVPVLYGIALQMVNADYSYRQFFYKSNMASGNNSGWEWIYSYCAAQTPVIPKDQCCVFRGGPEPTCKGQPPESTLLPSVNSKIGGQDDLKNASQKSVQDLYWPYYQALGPTIGQDVDFVKTAINYYTDQANQALTSYIASQGTNSNIDQALQVASAQGWIFAGAYYYALANMNSQHLKVSMPQLGWQDGDYPTSEFRNNYSSSNYLTAVASSNSANAAAVSNKIPELGASMQAIAAASRTIMDSFKDNLTGGSTSSNPLIALQRLGSILMIVAQTLFVVFFFAILTAGLLGGLNIFILGTGVTNPIAVAANIAAMVLVPLVYAALGIMISMGGLLAIYTPLIPFIMFAFGALSWIISTIEAMVAGPLVALHVLVPSEHQGPLGKAEGALMLVFNIFLRPSLMIFGMMGAMLLATVAIRLVNAGFGIVYNALIGTTAAPGSFDPISFFMLMGVYVMLVLAVLNKCFELINTIPQQVMRWIGGTGTEVSAPLQDIKGGVEGVGGRASGAMTAGTEQKLAKTGLDVKKAKKEKPSGTVK